MENEKKESDEKKTNIKEESVKAKSIAKVEPFKSVEQIRKSFYHVWTRENKGKKSTTAKIQSVKPNGNWIMEFSGSEKACIKYCEDNKITIE